MMENRIFKEMKDSHCRSREGWGKLEHYLILELGRADHAKLSRRLKML